MPRSMVMPEDTIYILHLTTEYSDDLYAFTTHEAAKLFAVQHAQECWRAWMGPLPVGEDGEYDHEEIVHRFYGKENPADWCSIEECELRN